MNNNGILYHYWSHLDQGSSPWHSWLNAKYAASGVTFFISMVRCVMNIFLIQVILLLFFFLDIYFFNNGCAVLLFFHGRSNAVRVGNLGTRTFDEICPAEICGYFTRNYRPVTCNLVNTLKLSVIIPAEVFIPLFYPFLRQRKPELTQFKLCLPGGCACRIPHPWPNW